MDIFESIDKDINLIDFYLHVFGDEEAMPAKRYLSTWKEEKSRYLWDIFDHQTIIQEPIVYHKPYEEMNEEFERDIWHESYYTDFMTSLTDILVCVLLKRESSDSDLGLSYHNYPNNRNEVDLICHVRNTFYDYDSAMAKNTFLDGKVVLPSEYNLLKKKFVITKGEKPFKLARNVIKRFAPICQKIDPEYFDFRFWEELDKNYELSRLRCSQWLNDAKVNGTLVLSIHPLDYLTMSDNDYDWDSCMTWTREAPGEFRCGVLEMMNSPCIVVGYVMGKHPYNIPYSSFTWSNKKWRELFIVDRDFVAGIEGYPYPNPAIEEVILNKLADLCEKHGWPAYSRDLCKNENEDFFINGLPRYFFTDYMYNDTTYHGTRMLKSTNPAYRDDSDCVKSYNYSGPGECLVCGRPIDHENRPVCNKCKKIVLCIQCSDEINLHCDSWSQDEDGNYYCENCSSTCPICEETKPSRDFTHFFAVFNNEKHDELSLYGCSTCIEPISHCLVTQTVHHAGRSFSSNYRRQVLHELTPRDLLIPFLRSEGYDEDYQDVPLAQAFEKIIIGNS